MSKKDNAEGTNLDDYYYHLFDLIFRADFGDFESISETTS